jgi:ATP-dependent Lon protease
MQPEMLPLFPLRVVLFPRTQIPLHIFEDRYKEMIGEAIRHKSEFGIVLAAEKGIVGTGCTAVVEQVTQTYPDGRMDIVVVGVRRFEIVDLDTEKSYLRGNVDFFNDDETDEPGDELKERALKGYIELKEFFGAEPLPDPKLEDPQASFQLAQLIGDVEFRQRLLALRSERERMRQLVEFLPGHVEQQRHAWRVRTVAPWNGHGPRTPVS